MHDVTAALGAWNSYYVLIGSSAGALTGLMFVVITIVRDKEHSATQVGISTFSTPTVVHFCCALFTAAVMSAPFRSLLPVAVLLCGAGAAGVAYVVRIARGTARLQTYVADAEDWSWHVLLPLVAYAALIAGAIALGGGRPGGLYAPALAVLLLVLIGIHNAWDVVTFIAVEPREKS